uniref:Translation initiation factor eIF2B subunit beta n=1 Tax=Pristionchus pacificus TaxID=54126 RepID=A0A8R1YG83_PRIPA
MAQVDAPAAHDINEIRTTFVHNLAKGHTRENSLKIAQATVNYIRRIIALEKYENIEDLLNVLRTHLRYSISLAPTELVVRNIFLIAMKLAREENMRVLVGVDKEVGNPYDSLNTLWKAEENSANASATGKKMRKGLAATIKEILVELDSSRELIVSRAVLQLNDTVLTYGVSSSPTLRFFLESARRTIKMRQILSVSSQLDDHSGPDFTSSISLRDVAAAMTDVTKVLLPVSVVFPDGSALMPAGSLSIAHAAARHAVPVYGLAAFYKIAPYYSADAASAVNAQAGIGLPVKLADSLRHRVILSPVFDVVPAHLLSLYISNSGAVLPSHMYRLIADYYHPEDLTEEL